MIELSQYLLLIAMFTAWYYTLNGFDKWVPKNKARIKLVSITALYLVVIVCGSSFKHLYHDFLMSFWGTANAIIWMYLFSKCEYHTDTTNLGIKLMLSTTFTMMFGVCMFFFA